MFVDNFCKLIQKHKQNIFFFLIWRPCQSLISFTSPMYVVCRELIYNIYQIIYICYIQEFSISQSNIQKIGFYLVSPSSWIQYVMSVDFLHGYDSQVKKIPKNWLTRLKFFVRIIIHGHTQKCITQAPHCTIIQSLTFYSLARFRKIIRYES